MLNDQSLLNFSPLQFIQYIKTLGIQRFWLVLDGDGQTVKVSHPELQSLADFINHDESDFMQHEGMFFQISHEYDTLFCAFIHKTHRGQGSGGLRYWQYDSMESLIRDGMRLAKGMTRKNALANLWWGGGKGIMAYNPNHDKNDPQIREAIYKDYGRFITSINGCYITAEDVGTNENDMGHIFTQTRFATCIPASVGGSGNPSSATALGVVCGMEAAVDFLEMGTIEGRTIAIQGLGHVAEPMIAYLFERKAAKVIAVDINADLVNEVQKKYAHENFEARLVDMSDQSILFEPCDILAPCATGAILNNDTIPKIQAKIICGASNNQLKNSSLDGQSIQDRGIVYVPDFLVNRMGIVNCADEQSGYVGNDPFFTKHLDRDYEFSVYQTSLRVLKKSAETNCPPAAVAIELADELAVIDHPIYGHRGQQIIQALVNNNWHLIG